MGYTSLIVLLAYTTARGTRACTSESLMLWDRILIPNLSLCPVFNHFQEWSNHKLGGGKDWEQGYWDHFFFFCKDSVYISLQVYTPKWWWLLDSVSECNCVSLTVWFFNKGGIVAGVQVYYKADRASTTLSLCVTWVECWRDTCLLFFLCLYRGNYQYSNANNNRTLVHGD